MKKKINIGTLLAGCLCILSVMTSCSNKVDFGEQYQKTLYIVNSNELLYTTEHLFEAPTNEIVISVYCASSKPIDSDVRVEVMLDKQVLDSLNNLNRLIDPLSLDKVLFPPTHYQLNEIPYAIIKAGMQYGTFSIPFDFAGLDPDVAYAFPITLTSNSAGYDINPALKSIVYEIKMINRYAGDYAGSSQVSTANVLGVQPVLKALSANTVRMPMHNLSGDWGGIDTNFMVLTVAQNGSVTITPWADAIVIDLGGSFYDADTQTFELHYMFRNAVGSWLSITEIITKLN